MAPHPRLAEIRWRRSELGVRGVVCGEVCAEPVCPVIMSGLELDSGVRSFGALDLSFINCHFIS